jgi:hypothetical protein
MKTLIIEPLHIGKFSLDTVFENVFGNEMLRKIHGDNTQITDWDNKNKRTIKFSVNVDNIPMELKRFFCGSKLRVTSRQTRDIKPNRINVNNRIKMHMVLSELFHVKPQFYLEETANEIYFGGEIKHAAVLPPPLNAICEGFMMTRSRREIEVFKQRILIVHGC